jgi:hypothetical protein
MSIWPYRRWRAPRPRAGDLRPDWNALYRDSLSRSERILGAVSNAVFTVWSFVIHVAVYVYLWLIVDWQPFLNAISVEAVIVSLCVGVNTKLQLRGDRVAQEQRDWIQTELRREIKEDHEDTKADKALTEAVHELTKAIHEHIVGE